MTDGVNVKCGKSVEVLYQTPSNDDFPIAEPAIIIQHYDQEGLLFGIQQGDQELMVSSTASLQQLGKALLRWAKETA